MTIGTSVTAQLDIQFGEVVKSKSYFQSFFPISESEFYAARGSRYGGGTVELSRYLNFQQGATHEVEITTGSGSASLEGSFLLDNGMVFFLSDNAGDKNLQTNSLYVQKFSKDCEPAGAPKLLSRIEVQKEWKKAGSYSVFTSSNKEFFCIEYMIPGDKDENNRFVYKIFSKKLKLMREGKYEVPYPSKVLNVSKRLISNTGDYFISCNIYNLGENWKVKDKYSFEKVILFHINENGIKEINLELDGRRAIEMNFASDDQGMMTLTGLYSDKMAIGVTGVFYFRYDFAKQKQVNGGFEAFSTEVYYE